MFTDVLCHESLVPKRLWLEEIKRIIAAFVDDIVAVRGNDVVVVVVGVVVVVVIVVV